MTTNPSPSHTRNASVKEPDETLLPDCRRFLKAVANLFEVLPEKARTKHLAETARQLTSRIDAATPNTVTEGSPEHLNHGHLT